MLVPLSFSLYNADGAATHFGWGLGVTAAAGLLLYVVTRGARRELQPRDGFLLVGVVWSGLPAFATIPLLLYFNTAAGAPGLSFTDAYFEMVSGLTTTCATLLEGLDALPVSINVWRVLLVWLGGMGIIVLTIAILPLLGVGGMQVYKAETPGPLKDSKLTPRITETAKGLYAVYLGISAACFLAYRAAGMSWTDAFIHMCTTVALGGFSSHDASFGYWNSPLIELIAVCFMLVAGINFAMHFLALKRRSLRAYVDCPEARWFVTMVLGGALLVSLYLWQFGVYDSYRESARYALFNVVSIATTTGYSSVDYGAWPLFAPLLMLLLSSFCTCAGSTGGGIKMIRAVLLIKQARRELVRSVHPRSVAPVRIGGGQVIGSQVLFSVLAFMAMYGTTILILTMLMLSSGLDPVTAFSAVMASMNNTGPGLGNVGPATTYASLNDFQTWLCTIGMLLGRLELLTLLVLFTRMFWRT
ncbi:MAG: TrkH family potassium uptake protein [Burkholderiales bacterium]|nr:MAG: TrkH family potassium uptake protein [Burkholderiales bacterium]